MNLQQAIAELEKQASQYTTAANTLRALLGESPAGGTKGKRERKLSAKAPKATNGRKKRGPMSDEARAKISAKLRAAHARRKKAAAKKP